MVEINEIHVLFLLGGCQYSLYGNQTALFNLYWAFCAVFGASMLAPEALANEANATTT